MHPALRLDPVSKKLFHFNLAIFCNVLDFSIINPHLCQDMSSAFGKLGARVELLFLPFQPFQVEDHLNPRPQETSMAFGRPGAGAPVRTKSGRLRSTVVGNPEIR